MAVISIFIFGFILLLACPIKGQVSCNRIYDGEAGPGYIVSPNYPFNYDNSQTCIYKFTLYKGNKHEKKKLCLTFERFQLDDVLRDQFHMNNTIFYGNGTSLANTSNIWEDACQNIDSTRPFTTVQFKSDVQYVNRGFRAKYEILPVEENHTGIKACSNNEWRCLNGTCIPREKVCAGKWDCDKFEDESYAHARCTPRRAFFIPEMAACDFSPATDFSCWDRAYRNREWLKESKSTNDIYGPSRAHTSVDGTGFYIRTSFTESAPKSIFYAVWLGIHSTTTYCLTFWYHMNGRDPGSLWVNRVWREDSNEAPVWSRKGNHGNKWHKGQLEASPSMNNSEIYPVFMVKRGGEFDTQVALDDISLLNRPCDDRVDISCNFERSFCGWKQSGAYLERAQESGRAQPPTDSSSGTVVGKYVAKRIGNIVLALESPPVTATDTPSCFSFHVYEIGNRRGTAEIEIEQTYHTSEKKIYSLRNFKTGEWVHFTVDVPTSDVPFNLVLYAYLKKPVPEVPCIFFDEFSLIYSPCNELDLKTCEPEEFRCYDTRLDKCIPAYLKCDGQEHCADGSDETDCPDPGPGYERPWSSGNIKVAVVVSIVATCVLLALIIFATVMCYHKRRTRRRNISGGVFQRRVSHDLVTNQPPAYNQCADNLVTYPNPNNEDSSPKEEFELPSYDVVENEHYVQITVPIEDKVQRMKEEMATRKNSQPNC